MRLIEYVKGEDGVPFGCVIAESANRFGWSMVNEDGGDKFEKKMAIKIAKGRIKDYVEHISYFVDKFEKRQDTSSCDCEKICKDFPRLSKIYFKLIALKHRAKKYYK